MMLAAMSGVIEASTLELGAPLPDVTVPDQNGDLISLKSYQEDSYVLVYFYPRADTPGCTKQACSLRDAYEPLQKQGVRIFGVSKDQIQSQQKFAEKYDLPFTLLADTEGKVIEAFGVPALGPFAQRQAYLFKSGVLVWRDLKASTDKQASDILDFLNKG